jgi:hypothetical protein
MSLRGSETTEAISQGADNTEIATLLPVARNDKTGIMTRLLKASVTIPEGHIKIHSLFLQNTLLTLFNYSRR